MGGHLRRKAAEGRNPAASVEEDGDGEICSAGRPGARRNAEFAEFERIGPIGDVGGGGRFLVEKGEGVSGADDGEVNSALQLVATEAEGEAGDDDKSDDDA